MQSVLELHIDSPLLTSLESMMPLFTLVLKSGSAIYKQVFER